jgi:hypothetical protein
MLGRRFRRRVRAVRRVGRRFGKESLVVVRKSAHDLVRRDVHETPYVALARRVQENLCADDVGAQEFVR